jgi:creatinine amidohydrolase/Fe(II)-dependent formamide hydrolase-like protein
VESHAVHTAFFFSAPGSVYRATKSGTWGDAREATPEMGERYLTIAADATLAVLDNIEKTFRAMPPR